MKLINNKFLLISAAFLSVFLASSCSKDDNADSGPGFVLATVTDRNIEYGQSITFTDMSQGIASREWTFEGGTPATSTDSIVEVTYGDGNGGVYHAQLAVTFKNVNQEPDTMNFTIGVKGKVKEDTYAIYTEDLTIAAGTDITIENNHAFPKTTLTSDVYEGSKALDFNIDGSDSWAMASILPANGPVDISKYADGYYNVALKSSSTGPNATILIRLQSNSNSQKAIITFDDNGQYGFKRDGQWHMVSIPIADFLANNPQLDLTSISSLMVLRSGSGNVTSANSYDFQIDNFYLSLVKY